MTEEEFEQYGLAGFDFIGGLKDLSNRGEGENKQRRLKNLISRLGICGINKLAQRVIQCLLGGVDLDTGLRSIIRAALNNMAPNYMEKLLVGLDPRVQEDIRKQVEAIFRNMPAPWETGYRPGSTTGFVGETRERAYEDATDSIQTKIDKKEDLISAVNSILFVTVEGKFYTSDEIRNTIQVAVDSATGTDSSYTEIIYNSIYNNIPPTVNLNEEAIVNSTQELINRTKQEISELEKRTRPSPIRCLKYKIQQLE